MPGLIYFVNMFVVECLPSCAFLKVFQAILSGGWHVCWRNSPTFVCFFWRDFAKIKNPWKQLTTLTTREVSKRSKRWLNSGLKSHADRDSVPICCDVMTSQRDCCGYTCLFSNFTWQFDLNLTVYSDHCKVALGLCLILRIFWGSAAFVLNLNHQRPSRKRNKGQGELLQQTRHPPAIL